MGRCALSVGNIDKCRIPFCKIIFTSSNKSILMNMKRATLIGLILLFLAMAGVSAADNVTDESVIQEDVLAESDDIASEINVTFDEQMWEGNLTDITVELPEEASGNFTVRINDEVIYNETITDTSFSVPIKLPKPKFIIIANMYPPMDAKTYKVSAFYNGIDLNITKPLKVMSYPPDYDYMRFPEEILQYGEHQVTLVFPRSANGTVEFYIDNRLAERTTARPILFWSRDPFSNLSLGNHTLRVSYLGDGYYRPFNKTFNFTVTNVIISIPKVINISHDDCISVRTLPSASGTVKVYIDGRLVASSKTSNGEYILSLENYIRYTDREVKVAFEGKDFSRTKNQSVNMTYDFDVWFTTFTYGDNNAVEVMLPDTLDNRLLTIEIDGKKYSFRHPENIANNIVEVDISKLDAGNHTMVVSFKGDSKFYALQRTYNITVDYNFYVPDEIEYKDSSKVSLKLPGDANGNLEVYVDGKLFKSSKLNKGYAQIIIDSFAPGYHQLGLKYTGSDYNVSGLNTSFTVLPKISLTYRFTAGEDKYLTVEVPKSSKGYVIFNIDDVEHKVTIKDGIARYSLKKLDEGEHDIYIDYYGADGFEDLEEWRVVTVYKAKIKSVSAQATFKGITVKAKLLTRDGKPLKSKVVTVRFNGKTYKIKTNKKGILTFKKSAKLKAKKCTVKIYYMGSKLTKKLKVKQVHIKAGKTKRKLVVKAYINKKAKNEVVKIKVNSKVYKVKTNRKGMAKLSIKKPKRIKAIKATYLKDSVKCTVKVKK